MTENPVNLHKSIEAAKQLRLQIALMIADEQAAAENRELTADDERAIQDTFEGETTLDTELERAILAEDEDLILIEGIEKRQQELADRKSRIKKRVEARRGLMQQAMTIAGWTKKETPFGTISLGKPSVSVAIDAEEQIPTIYWKPQDPVLDKAALGKALRNFRKEIDSASKIKDATTRSFALAGLVGRLPQSDAVTDRMIEANGINDPAARCDAYLAILNSVSPVPGAHLQESGPSISIRRK